MVKSNVKVSVSQGQVHVNSGWLAHQSKGSLVYEFDLRAKYAQLYGMSGNGVYLAKNESTESFEQSDQPTVVRFEGLPDGSTIHAVVMRYSLFVHIFVPDANRREMVWSDDQG